MTCLYLQIPAWEDYKSIETQMKDFNETTHTTVDGFYHKSIRIKLDEKLTVEFHGPLVKAAEFQTLPGGK